MILANFRVASLSDTRVVHEVIGVYLLESNFAHERPFSVLHNYL